MKIAFILRRFPTLSETFILNQITGLMDLGHTVDIYSTMESDTEKIHPDVNSYRLLYHLKRLSVPKGWGARVAGALPALARGLLSSPLPTLRSLDVFRFGRSATSLRLLYLASSFNKRYDIIHCHYGVLGDMGITLKKLGAGADIIVTSFHGFDITTWVGKHGELVYDDLFSEGDLFLPISEKWRQRLIELGCPSEKILVHHMGVDCERFTFKPRLLDKEGKIELASVARFVEKKGLEYSIRAVAALMDEYPRLRYTIAGNGELFEDMRKLVENLGASQCIKLSGWMPQNRILELLQKSHILITPSVTAANGDQEGIPVVLMEAMAMGLQIVTTIHSGIPELVEEGVTGKLVPERDPIALENALRELLETPDEWSRMGRAGREKVESKFNSRKQVLKLVRYYDELTGTSS
ncbi:MAG: glycosyltransferase [Candidatus Aegiribacteria sp.]|nr:glycosyltransferase [Candidatus Aegiribacteria sp.]